MRVGTNERNAMGRRTVAKKAADETPRQTRKAALEELAAARSGVARGEDSLARRRSTLIDSSASEGSVRSESSGDSGRPPEVADASLGDALFAVASMRASEAAADTKPLSRGPISRTFSRTGSRADSTHETFTSAESPRRNPSCASCVGATEL